MKPMFIVNTLYLKCSFLLLVLWMIAGRKAASINNMKQVYFQTPYGQEEENKLVGQPQLVNYNFTWGVSTSAYQIEGAWDTDGKTMSVWDDFVRRPGKVKNQQKGDNGTLHYYKMLEDVDIMKQLQIRSYRFSMSWTRLLPKGGCPEHNVSKCQLNPKGVSFYHRLLDALEAAHIEPYVTIYHWDLPLSLFHAYGGLMSEQVVEDIRVFAEVLFREFGRRVHRWITFNEPWIVCNFGYADGVHAPGVVGMNPYICGHHILKAHGLISQVFKSKYKNPGDQLGMTINVVWYEPYDNKSSSREACERGLIYDVGWFGDPIYFGDYPAVMKERLGDLLPEFTESEKKMLKGSSDFFGLNQYTSRYGQDDSSDGTFAGILLSTQNASRHVIGVRTATDWMYVVPLGFRRALGWVSKRYGNPGILVTENGFCLQREHVVGVTEAIYDSQRILYLQEYLHQLDQAIRMDGVKVFGYFGWALMDNFEWTSGYSVRFGLVYIDYKNNYQRHIKQSGRWIAKYFTEGKLKELSKPRRISAPNPIDYEL